MKSPRSPSASAGLFICGEGCAARMRARRGSVASPRLRAWTSLARGSESHQPPLHEKPAVALRRGSSRPPKLSICDSLRWEPTRASKLRSRLRALVVVAVALRLESSRPAAIDSRRGVPERAKAKRVASAQIGVADERAQSRGVRDHRPLTARAESCRPSPSRRRSVSTRSQPIPAEPQGRGIQCQREVARRL